VAIKLLPLEDKEPSSSFIVSINYLPYNPRAKKVQPKLEQGQQLPLVRLQGTPEEVVEWLKIQIYRLVATAHPR
jgi:hypothetical protein